MQTTANDIKLSLWHDAAHRKIKGYYISPDELKRAKEGNK